MMMQQYQQPTMSSLEIAELVESRHDKVRLSIQRLANRGVIQLPPMGEVKNHLGQRVAELVSKVGGIGNVGRGNFGGDVAQENLL